MPTDAAPGLFAKAMQDAGMDAAMARLAIADLPGEFSECAVAGWVSGAVVPNANIREALGKVADLDLETTLTIIRATGGKLEGRPLELVDRLCDAVKSKSPSAIAASLKDGVIIDGWDSAGRCAIDYAAAAEDTDSALMLLRAGAAPTAMIAGFGTAWRTALNTGNSAVIRMFVAFGAHVESGRGDGFNSSIDRVVAAAPDDPDLVEFLFRSDNFGVRLLDQPFLRAAALGKLKTLARFLDLGVSPTTFDEKRNRALDMAAESGRLDTVKLLITRGAALHVFNNDGDTALHKAARHGHVDIAAVLLQAGTDPDQTNDNGERAASQLPASLALNRAGGPDWLDRSKQPFFFAYSKAFALGFDPRNLDGPFLIGGDYDGVYPSNGAALLSMEDELVRHGQEWILAFAEKVKRRENFSVADLHASAIDAGFEPFTRSEYS